MGRISTIHRRDEIFIESLVGKHWRQKKKTVKTYVYMGDNTKSAEFCLLKYVYNAMQSFTIYFHISFLFRLLFGPPRVS
jgi:hypothetical protein